MTRIRVVGLSLTVSMLLASPLVFAKKKKAGGKSVKLVNDLLGTTF